MKKIFLALLFMVSVFIQGCTQGSDSSKTSVLLVLYSYPTHWFDDEALISLSDSIDGDFVTIINPDNGVGYSKSETFVEGIEYLHSLHFKVIGYIYTLYGSRDKEEIYDEIDRYAEFYSPEHLEGIFFDEVELSTSENESYMKDIASYARQKGFNLIAINPGSAVNQSIVDENFYDIIMTYENPYSSYVEYTNTLLSSSKTKQALAVYDVPEMVSFLDEVKKAKSMHFDYIYFTIDGDPNPWDSVYNFLK